MDKNDNLTTLAKRLRPFLLGSGSGAVQEGPGIDVVGVTVGLGGDTILLYDSGGNPVAEFAPDAAGFDAATAAATSGDMVQIPALTIPGDHTLKSGVRYTGMSRLASRLTGEITGADLALLENLTIYRAANDASTLIGLKGPATGEMKVNNCAIYTLQSGSGDTYAISTADGGDIVAYVCDLQGDSVGGDGYGARSYNGYITLEHCRCHGSTDRLLEDW